MPKIVLFGATGYTGRLTAEALTAHGDSPVLAGRSASALAELAAGLGGARTAVADVRDPDSVAKLLEPGDVLVTTVGPFLRYGAPALDAALAVGAHYIDSTGEGPFIRTVFEAGDRARGAGVALLSAFGFDYVPGNLAAGLALREAPDAARVDVGYFMDGPATSGGTRASVAGMLFERGFTLRDGRIVDEPAAARVRTFDVGGKTLTGLSIPASEQFAFTGTHPGLRSVDVYLGLPPLAARAMRLGARLATAAARFGPLRQGLEAVMTRAVPGSTGGPDAATRARVRSRVVAEAYDEHGNRSAAVTLVGGDPYEFTAHMLAWGARTASNGGLLDVGALGPVQAFGLDAVEAAATAAGWSR